MTDTSASPVPPIADAHSDLLLELAHAEHRLGEQNPLPARWLEPLRLGGVHVQVCAVYVLPEHLPAVGLREALRMVRAFHNATERNPNDVMMIRDARDIDDIGEGRIGMLLALESADCLGEDPWLIDVFARLGVRMASLTYNDLNAFGGGCATDVGLTVAGRELVRRMVAHRMVVDLAHASEATFWDTLDEARDGAVVVTHTACRALHDHRRNLSDAQLRALAERGGVAGIMAVPHVLGGERANLDRLVDHIDHAVSVAGARHVALGGDFARQISHAIGLVSMLTANGPVALDEAVDGLAGPEEYPALIGALRRRGYSDADIAAVAGGNLLRVLRRTLPT